MHIGHIVLILLIAMFKLMILTYKLLVKLIKYLIKIADSIMLQYKVSKLPF